MLLLIVVVVILVLLFGSHPRFGYHNQGYRPISLFSFCLIIVLLLWAFGRL